MIRSLRAQRSFHLPKGTYFYSDIGDFGAGPSCFSHRPPLAAADVDRAAIWVKMIKIKKHPTPQSLAQGKGSAWAPFMENRAVVASGEHQPGGAGPRTALWHPNTTLCPRCQHFPRATRSLFGGQACGGAGGGSRDTLTGWGSGRLGQPLHPLQKVHSSAGVPSTAKPPTGTQPPRFAHGRRNKASASFSGAEKSDPMPHGCSPSPMGHPVGHVALQAQNRFLCEHRRGCGLACGLLLQPSRRGTGNVRDPLSPSLPAKTKLCMPREVARATGGRKRLRLRGG